MGDIEILRWADGRFVVDEWCDVNTGDVRVADSFVIADGSVVGFDRHLDRFSRSVASIAPEFDGQSFRSGLAELLPRNGVWFPRIEACDYGNGLLFRVMIRPAPVRESTVSVVTAATDPRRFPHTKGPDLHRLGAMRRETNSAAGEAIILDSGMIAEGAWSSIMWWEEGVLHRVASDIPRLAGITESVIVDRARLLGAPVIDARRTPQQLDGCEVWVLSALHGIRVVTEWINGPTTTQEPGRADYWRTLYETQRIMLEI
jgi:branched-subunit amino acid aminotransferase/4-amino-4-deoxychorismate lyase